MDAYDFIKAGEESLRRRWDTQRAAALERPHAEFAKLCQAYEEQFRAQLSIEQQICIARMLSILHQQATEQTHAQAREALDAFSNIGVHYVVRHPETLMEGYANDRAASRTLTRTGVLQVHKFNKYLVQVLQAYSRVHVRIFYSEKYRTELFAKLTSSALQRNAHPGVSVHCEGKLDDLYSGCIEEMRRIYPAVAAAFSRPSMDERMRVLQQYFAPWARDGPSARIVARRVHLLVAQAQPATINIYITHENVIAPYLFHVRKYSLASAFLQPAQFVRIVPPEFLCVGQA